MNSAFSPSNPNLQVVWDSTSLRALMECPRKYHLGIMQGWRNGGVDLEFGGYFAEASEAFDKARLEGKDKEEATLIAVQRAVESSWDYKENIPWGGDYLTMWRCTGALPYKNPKGNKAKCPYSHKGKWFPTSRPMTCGVCGSDTEEELRYLPLTPAKNRHSLVRLTVWYCDEQPEDWDDGVKPYAFPDGTPAVELSFKLPLPWKSPWGDTYILAGHLDKIKSFGDENFVADNKTTKNIMGDAYWSRFSPDIQVDTYDLAGSLLYPDLALKGVMIEGAQVMVGGARFGSRLFYRSDEQREEYLRDLEYYLRQAEKYAEEGYWPMNRASCKMCEFRGVCSQQPHMRERVLRADFEQRPWNPAEER